MKRLKREILNAAEKRVILFTLLLLGVLIWLSLQSSWRLQREISRKGALGRIESALKNYWRVKKQYPPNSAENELLACGAEKNLACGGGQKWEDENYLYLDSFPDDPLFSSGADWPNFGYRTNQDQSFFWLWVFLENEADPDLASSWQNCPGLWEKNQYVICGGNNF
ncbi:MAG: hypothetical protein JW991_02815 [Candidatus Pacebacteria bacterium]|nr:hypothetical protein [Candidatus Paceibacterota bacterium]